MDYITCNIPTFSKRQECQTQMDYCERHAQNQFERTGDPRYFEWAAAFRDLSRGDQTYISPITQDGVLVTVQGGCAVLDRHGVDTRQVRNVVEDQVRSYRNGDPALVKPVVFL